MNRELWEILIYVALPLIGALGMLFIQQLIKNFNNRDSIQDELLSKFEDQVSNKLDSILTEIKALSTNITRLEGRAEGNEDKIEDLRGRVLKIENEVKDLDKQVTLLTNASN